MKLLRKVYHFLILLRRVNLIKTIYFNFKMLPFNQAIKIPILLYGKIVFHNLSGKLTIQNDVSSKMIRIGYRWIDLWPSSFLPTQIQIIGEIKFCGKAIISGGANINVQHKDGVLILGSRTVVGGGSVVKCLDRIEIGDGTRITGNCVIMDCNMHFVKNINTGIVANFKAPILIGRNCWINNGTIVSKGSVIPDYSISSRNAYISKDFSSYGTNLFLVGAPAKPTASKVQRIFTVEKQEEYSDYFASHNTDILQLEPGIEIESGHEEGF